MSSNALNPEYKKFLELPEKERLAIFETSAERLDTLGSYIEKDFWVCYTLDAIYNNRPEDHPRILFKGGTSLSKVFGAINRFSEDIDVVIFREDLGFSGKDDPTNPELGTNQRRRLVEAINEKARHYIINDLAETLKESLPDCNIKQDSDNEDGMTLLVHYPSLYKAEGDEYVSPRVKIEGGARSALDPHDIHSVIPYIQKDLEDFDFNVPNLVTIAAERTLLEKTLILHGWYCRYRDEKKLPIDRNRLSRHYYDVAMMASTDIADVALNDKPLFENVIEHTQILFSRGWMKLGEISTDQLYLVPVDDLAKQLEKDYMAMQGMIHGESPKFGEIIESLAAFEKKMNK